MLVIFQGRAGTGPTIFGEQMHCSVTRSYCLQYVIRKRRRMSSLPFYNISEFCSLDCSNRRTCTDKWKVYLLLFFFLIHIKGTFSDMTQVKQAKTTNHFLFRNFALIKKKKRQPKISHPLEQGTDESLRTTASMTPLYLVGKW